jgi:uncharacterized protein (TIGR03086 family)
MTRRNRMADSDHRNTLLDSYENAAVIVSGIVAGELGHPTPCPRYDVAGLIDHLVEAGHRAAALGRGQAPPAGDGSPHVELSDAPGQLRSAAQEAARAWGDDSSLSLRFTMPWGEEYTGATLVDMYLAELAAHAWDLARATGQIAKLDPSLAVPALEGARAMIKPQYRNMAGQEPPSGRRSAQLPVLMTGNASLPSRDANHGQRSVAYLSRFMRPFAHYVREGQVGARGTRVRAAAGSGSKCRMG